MPEPEKGESEVLYMKRCIPYMIKHEGREKSQSIAICFQKYRKSGTEEKSPKPQKKKLSKNDKAKIFLMQY